MSQENSKPATRTSEQIRQHYLVEKELATRLRTASKEARRELYSSVYDELFRRVPDHPQLAMKDSAGERRAVHDRLELLAKFLKPESTYLEIGAGDCSLAIEVANRVRKVYALDVSEEIARGVRLPDNMELILSDGCSVPVSSGTVHVAYSDQLMEHLHPDDAAEQLRQIYGALAPGGVYICITPNRLSGPHDVSQYFDDVASGFHLREYTAGELRDLFRKAGFSKTRILAGARASHVVVPDGIARAVETLLEQAPVNLRRKVALSIPFRMLLGVKLIAWK